MSGECNTCNEHTLDCKGHDAVEGTLSQMMESATSLLLNHKLSDDEFEHCVNSIMIVIEHFRGKRMMGWV